MREFDTSAIDIESVRIMGPEQKAQVDLAAAHRHFSAACFNKTWELIDKPNRSDHENVEMLLGAQASLWHWSHRSDCTHKNLSIGHWQTSRVCALLGSGQEAMRHAEMSLKYAHGLRAFYLAYSHEAIARAALVLGDKDKFSSHLAEVRKHAAVIVNVEEREQLDRDIAELESAMQSKGPRSH
jgi:hypothetical protein